MLGSVAEAERFLAARGGSEVADLAPIGRGEWSCAYAYRQGGRAWVIRFSATDEDFQKDRLAARFAAPALPIPAVAEVGEAEGRFYAIAERIYGTFLDELDAAQMRAALPSLLAMFDAMRRVDLSGTHGYGVWGADGNAPHVSWREALLNVGSDRPGTRIQGWRARLETSPIGMAAFDMAFARLQQLTPYLPEARHLVHSDLLNFNVLVDGEKISAVLDWGCAMYGDFLYDLAWFLFWQPWYAAWRKIDFLGEAAHHFAMIGLEVPHLEERLCACQTHIGLDSLAYNASKERWEILAEVAERTLAVAVEKPTLSK